MFHLSISVLHNVMCHSLYETKSYIDETNFDDYLDYVFEIKFFRFPKIDKAI